MNREFLKLLSDNAAVEPTSAPSRRIAVVGNFPPTRCGIATFTADFVAALTAADQAMQADIYAMRDELGDNSGNVTAIAAQDRDAYRETGLTIDRSGAQLVWLQHEFGIFGGDAGEWVIDLLAPIAAPLVVTLHTILTEPTAAQRRVMAWLVGRASAIVVMSDFGARTLVDRYGAEAERVIVIPHGVPDRPFGRNAMMKTRFDIAGAKVGLTFGLLSPGKGLENVIAALPAIVAAHPEFLYCIAGATHDKLRAREGEAYRERMEAMAAELGVRDHIRWINRFIKTDELLDLIEAADIYITPYIQSEQATSGTLAYAVALGKAVISTPYHHASELLADGVGALVPFGRPDAIAEATVTLLGDAKLLTDMQRRAWRLGRTMTWSSVAEQALGLIDRLALAMPPESAGAIRSQHALLRLCDDTGMFQHGCLTIADRAHGYCIDDNARALMLSAIGGGQFSALADRFAAFVQHGWNPDLRLFRNFMGYDRRWLEDAGSEDSNGRTLWALGVVAALAKDVRLRQWAAHLWQRTAPIALDFASPRAISFAVLGAAAMVGGDGSDQPARAVLQHGADRLLALFDAHATAERPWFEPYLAYDNARLGEALLVAGARLENSQAVEQALSALIWLDGEQTAPAGHFRPVGSRGLGQAISPPEPFDQQAVEAWASVDAAAAAFAWTGDPRWVDAAERAFSWFTGRNDRQVALGDPATGACYDGVTPQGLNLNQGAESVLALHLANHTMASAIHARTPAIKSGQADHVAA